MTLEKRESCFAKASAVSWDAAGKDVGSGGEPILTVQR
jgi:hypothetical protein